MPIPVMRVNRTFRTTDGTEFGYRNEAICWQNELDLRGWFERSFAEVGVTLTSEQIAAFTHLVVFNRNEIHNLTHPRRAYLTSPPRSIGKPVEEYVEGKDVHTSPIVNAKSRHKKRKDENAQ